MIEALRKQSEYVRSNEPGTLSYYFMIPQKESADLVIGFELYESKDALKKHAKSDGMKSMQEAFKSGNLQSGMDLQILEPTIGFLTRPNSSKMMALNLLAEITFKPGTRDEGIQKSTPVAEDVENSEYGTLSYYFMKDTKDANKLVVFEGYESQEAFSEGHAKNPVVAKNRNAQQTIREKTNITFCVPVAGFHTSLDQSKL